MRFRVKDLPRDKREALLEWVKAEGLVPEDIRDDGRFTVYGGLISGNELIRDGDGDKIIRNGDLATKHFVVKQKNPLPEILDPK